MVKHQLIVLLVWLGADYGSFTLAKFVFESISDIEMQYRLPYLPWPSGCNTNDHISVTLPKVARASKAVAQNY